MCAVVVWVAVQVFDPQTHLEYAISVPFAQVRPSLLVACLFAWPIRINVLRPALVVVGTALSLVLVLSLVVCRSSRALRARIPLCSSMQIRCQLMHRGSSLATVCSAAIQAAVPATPGCRRGLAAAVCAQQVSRSSLDQRLDCARTHVR